MTGSSTLRVGGGVVFWSVGQWTSRTLLREGLGRFAFGSHTPEPRTPSACLRDALGEVFTEKSVMVRPLQTRDGFAVIEEGRGEDQNSYTHRYAVKVDGDSHITISPYSREWQEAVVGKFNEHLGLLRAAQVSGALVNILGSLGGTRLRPSGAIYWLPEGMLDVWAGVAQAVEGSAARGRSSVYVLRHQMDADAVRAIRDAICAEVLAESQDIHDDIMSGELGQRALASRAAQAESLRAKVGAYEELLSCGLGHLREAVDRAEQGSAAAELMASAAAGVA